MNSGDEELGVDMQPTDDGIQLSQVVNARLDFIVPQDLDSRYATHFAIQGGDHEYVLSFFEARPALAFTQPVTTPVVPARCVARIIIAEDRLSAFMQLLKRGQQARREQREQKVAEHPRSEEEE